MVNRTLYKKPRIFISYAREDLEKALSLYEDLKKANCDPWIDQKNLLPGEPWKIIIRETIKTCDFFLACLSSKSVSKIGFFQTELKDSYEIMKQYPSENIFLIPIRFEDCDVPIEVKEYHWVDILEKDGFTKLLEAIQKEWKRRGFELCEPKTDDELEQKGSEFVSQITIVGHLVDANQIQHAIYLDDELYVHRKHAESEVLTYIDKFVNREKPEGKWVSIVGDGGHGKSCFLWYLYKSLKKNNQLTIMPFLAQLLTDKPFDEIKETVVRVTAKMDRPLLVLIDTLDILVGINDHTLATTLNFLIASGCMLITCSRKQEIEKLSIFIQSDKQVELDRYNEHEAKDAIQNYINICYPNWSEEGKKHQFSKVWELLDQQRSVGGEERVAS